MKYFLCIDGEGRGPYDEDQIREMLGRGAIPTVTLTLEENGSGEWSSTYLPGLIGPAKPQPVTPAPYYILKGEETKGPYTIGQLRGMWNTGTITGNTQHCQEGNSAWQPLNAILHQLEPPTAPASPVPQPSVVVLTARKSRGVYIILGLFLGTLGIHNFYAGYHGKGAMMLIITLLSLVLALLSVEPAWLLIGSIITGLGALLEICFVTEDANGDRMT